MLYKEILSSHLMLDNDKTIATVLVEQKNRNSIDLSLNRFRFSPFFEMLYFDIHVLTQKEQKEIPKSCKLNMLLTFL